MILWELFFCFLQVGLFSVGGGYAAVPLIQSQAVAGLHWLSLQEFTDLVTIAEMTPGPIAVNAATFIGLRMAGATGAVIATLGCILPSCFLVSLLAHFYLKYKNLPAMEHVLSCLRPAVVAMIACAGLAILRTVLFSGKAPRPQNLNVIGALLFAAAFCVLRKTKLNPVLVLCCCGATNLGLGLLLLHFPG